MQNTHSHPIENCILNNRLLPFDANRIYGAFADPAILAAWWGPEGFTNTFDRFDFCSGGEWRFTMHGPDGKNYLNECRFGRLEVGKFVEIQHVVAPLFKLYVTLESKPDGTHLYWCQAFENQQVRDEVAAYAENCNEQNLDKLTAVLNAKSQPDNFAFYLGFDGHCEEAFAFYAKHLGGTVTMLSRFSDSPDGSNGNMPDAWRDKIMHGRIQVGNYLIMGGDAPPGMYQKPAGFNIQMQFYDNAAAEKAFNALAEGGEIRMPMAETFWAERFGMVVDKFGTPWIINGAYRTFCS